MPSVQVSRGRLTSLWVLVRTIEKLGGQCEVSELLSVGQRSGMRAGGLPLRDGLALAREGRFVRETAGVVAIGSLGKHALSLCPDDEPNPEVLRLFLSVLLLASPPPWVAWWQGAPDDLAHVIPNEERLALKAAGLFPAPGAADPAGWAWWQALNRVPLPEQRALARKEIGDAGEQLTIEYERGRLIGQGYTELADRVAWLARESDAYGFDVLSYAGDDFPTLDAAEPIAVEVKSTSLPVIDAFSFYLTAHEWETAQGLGARYVLHLWVAVQPGTPLRSATPAPLVRSTADLREHLPGPPACGGRCRWESAQVTIPLA